jgi:integrase
VRIASGHIGNVSDLPNTFRHEPYIATFRSGSFDFRFLLIHTRWTTASERAKEVEQIANDYRFFQTLGRERDLILAGDFNYADDVDVMRQITELDDLINLIPNNTETTLKGSGEGFSSSYDHIFVHKEATKERTGKAGAYDFVLGQGFTSTQAAKKELSDHLPVWEVLDSLPKVRLEKEPEGRVRYLGQYAHDEEARLVAACRESVNQELPTIVLLLLHTGGRRSEVLNLTWENGVDFAQGYVTFHQTKNGRRRSVPMTQTAYAALSALPGPHEGRVFRTRSVRTAFERAVERAKLENFHLHDCRHTFASRLVMRGVSLQAVKELLGPQLAHHDDALCAPEPGPSEGGSCQAGCAGELRCGDAGRC